MTKSAFKFPLTLSILKKQNYLTNTVWQAEYKLLKAPLRTVLITKAMLGCTINPTRCKNRVSKRLINSKMLNHRVGSFFPTRSRHVFVSKSKNRK